MLLDRLAALVVADPLHLDEAATGRYDPGLDRGLTDGGDVMPRLTNA
jgi:hypothetical protein